ncbi:helix-turn-helix domain-containing protein [Mycobacteroides abscessus]|uniref:helix-turn-helix domain-containing protein n=1 Tax=Mycobacteroides abscessus TaxID=36809 RepID=UPI0005E1DEA2|nr:helix-turn-helix domain-containing protein [Mycobacteroides abscessus]CPR70009.1 DNA binding domain%2C excisionase family [Mycobacteroides abscessus]CPU70457.1 DNA binding domain%2C excisionase family [Mycobacteroides abscessus]
MEIDNEIEHELLTTAEVAALRRCSVETVRRRIRDGSLPVVRQGRAVLVRREDALSGDQ